jgi:hypothetical protein
MKVGDLVKHQALWVIGECVGIVIETGVYTGNKDMKVMWQDGRVLMYASKYMKVIK